MDAERESTAPVVESGLMWAFLAIRLVHLVQGVICVVSGWSAYRRPRLAAAVLGLVGAESVWLVARGVNRRSLDEGPVRVDAVAGTAGLVGLSLATRIEDRTTSLNWMLPVTVGSAVGLALDSKQRQAVAAVGALSAVYLGSSVRAGTRPGQIVTALANGASYFGFYTVAGAVIRRGRREGAELDATRAESAARGERLAIEEERNRQHRLLHDSALQTLEGIAGGLITLDDEVRGRARSEARRLRRALSGTEPVRDLAGSLDGLAAEFAGQGLEVVFSVGAMAEVSGPTAVALIEAVRESLRNVTKHAATTTAVVRAEEVDGRIRVTVRDQGRGFEPADIGPGFGLRQSVAGRLAEVGGSAEVWSRPGRGTRVTLWAPAR